jgi:hypothetical protein
MSKPGKGLSVALGSTAAMALVMAALWIWQNAASLVGECSSPSVALWAVRCATAALAAGAQLVLLTFVVAQVYGRDLLVDLLRVLVGLGCSIALVSAIALGLAGR